MPDREPPGWPWLRERLIRLRRTTRPGAPAEIAAVPVVRTAVVTDSAAALPASWVRDFTADGRLTVVPMPVMVGAEIFGEGEDDIAETIAVALAGAVPVR
ncbi:MAG TPA: fatty acid-binding protein DegV, partial [Arthrobacter sp.]|nr:fatty acid-binding protein DegV [Arthrobacter sp.]